MADRESKLIYFRRKFCKIVKAEMYYRKVRFFHVFPLRFGKRNSDFSVAGYCHTWHCDTGGHRARARTGCPVKSRMTIRRPPHGQFREEWGGKNRVFLFRFTRTQVTTTAARYVKDGDASCLFFAPITRILCFYLSIVFYRFHRRVISEWNFRALAEFKRLKSIVFAYATSKCEWRHWFTSNRSCGV